MSNVILLTTPPHEGLLKEILANSGERSVITDLDPDTNIMCGNADIANIANNSDCELSSNIVNGSNPKVLSSPKLIKKHDDYGIIGETLEELAKPNVDPPKNGKFTKEYLFVVIVEHCNLIVEERKPFIRKPGHHWHSCMYDAVNLEIFLKEYLEWCGVADAATLRKQITSRKCKAVYHLCITDSRSIARAVNFNNDGNYLPVANGIVHVENGKADLLLYHENPNLCFKYCVNANYDPDAEHDVWDSFTSDYIGNNEKDIQRYWQGEGNLLFPNPTAKTILVKYGAGNDGKSVEAGFRQALFNPCDAVFDADIGQALSQFGTEAFKDAQILHLHEANGEITLAQANKIKRITGGDKLMLDKKFFNLVTRLVKTKISVTCNHLPRFATGALDQALENRFQFIKVSSVPIEFRTASLKDDLYKQRDYYLYRAVQGYAQLQKNHYEFTKSNKDSALKKAVFSANPAKAFVDDCCDNKTVTPKDYILIKDWKIVVKVWKQDICERFDFKTLKWALVNLGYRFEKLTTGPNRNRYAFIGLRFNEYSLNILNKHEIFCKGGGKNE